MAAGREPDGHLQFENSLDGLFAQERYWIWPVDLPQ